MSISYHIIGIKPADKKFSEMLEIYRLCDEQGFDPPGEVLDFFKNVDYKFVEKSGVIVGMNGELKSVCKEWKNKYGEGYEVDVNDIPKDVKVLRFYISG